MPQAEELAIGRYRVGSARNMTPQDVAILFMMAEKEDIDGDPMQRLLRDRVPVTALMHKRLRQTSDDEEPEWDNLTASRMTHPVFSKDEVEALRTMASGTFCVTQAQ